VSPKILRDPIHGYIELSKCAERLIDTEYFQRLRRVNQLSFSNLVFHGAEHSRFGHSLGVYHLAVLLNETLLKNEENEIKDEFSIAGLLHDIGHHPFSHSFERVLKFNRIDREKYDHEEYSVKIIEDTEVGIIIEEEGISKENILHLLKGSYTEKAHLQYLNSLISSEFDIDRLDYLVRDSHYCGVTYGVVDIERLFHSLEPKDDKIIINEKGMHSAEMYVLSRYYMYTQVYTHRTTRAFDIMLNKIFNKEKIEELEYPSIEDKNFDRFKYFDDAWLWNEIREISEKAESKEKRLATDIITRNPIRCVIEAYSLMDRDTEYVNPDYQTIKDLQEDREIFDRTKIDQEYICFDEPWSDLPIESEYRPYILSNYSPDEKEPFQEKSPILIHQRREIEDIANIPSSIAYNISRQLAQVIRLYTINEKRRTLCEFIKEIRPRLSPLIWFEKC
jgi:hypothetical protein